MTVCPEKTLFTILKKVGCGKRMLKAIMAIYQRTVNILNSECIRSTIGVKQGGPMSCILFVIYLNVLSGLLKLIGDDSYLKDLHALMLMDDTVLLGSSREMIENKFETMMRFCKDYGMVINEVKTKLMVINGSNEDREKITIQNVVVKHTTTYIYLGSPFTEDGRIDNVLSLHVKSRMSDLNKFKIFCYKNSTMPYKFKRKVLDAVMLSLFYGCESWLSEQTKSVEVLYRGALKALLGVRGTTRNDTILIETGMPLLKDLIAERTKRYVKKKLLDEKDEETPLFKIYKLCEENKTKGHQFIKKCINSSITENVDKFKEGFNRVQGSKAVVYKEMNTDLRVHDVYTTGGYIDERKRVSFTKFRLSSHRLKIETGRWSRIPRDNRLCECGDVQDEVHVALYCPKTNALRNKYNFDNREILSLNDLMKKTSVNVVEFIHECMELY